MNIQDESKITVALPLSAIKMTILEFDSRFLSTKFTAFKISAESGFESERMLVVPLLEFLWEFIWKQLRN